MAKLANCEPINIKSVIHMQLDPTYVWNDLPSESQHRSEVLYKRLWNGPYCSLSSSVPEKVGGGQVANLNTICTIRDLRTYQ